MAYKKKKYKINKKTPKAQGGIDLTEFAGYVGGGASLEGVGDWFQGVIDNILRGSLAPLNNMRVLEIGSKALLIILLVQLQTYLSQVVSLKKWKVLPFREIGIEEKVL